MNWRMLKPFMVCATVAATVVGCTSETGHGTVDGTVTLDGQPLQTGLIRFEPADGQTPTADAMITNGSFTVKAPVGEKRVSISGPKVVGKRKAYESPDSPTLDIVEELLPARYNVQSTLTLTVEEGKQSKNFELESAK
jgi:hypothetical protein